MNILDIFKSLRFCFQTFGVRRSFDSIKGQKPGPDLDPAKLGPDPGLGVKNHLHIHLIHYPYVRGTEPWIRSWPKTGSETLILIHVFSAIDKMLNS